MPGSEVRRPPVPRLTGMLRDSGDGALPRLGQGGPVGVRALRDQVAAVVREQIISGELPPGVRLREQELSDRHQVSRGPLREALRQLEVEGLVRSEPYRGSVVTQIDTLTVHEVLMPVRVVLEICGFRHARAHLDEAAAADLGAHLARMAEAARRGDTQAVVELDVDFHRAVMQLSGMAEASRLWESLSGSIRRFFYTTTQHSAQYLNDSVVDHQRLLDALRDAPPEELESLVRSHILDVPGYPQR
ncbi:GntR family transcriptional regulator [Pseudactinotalea suaedae]